LINTFKRNSYYLNLLIYFYKKTIFSEINEIIKITSMYVSSAVLLAISLSNTSKLFKFLLSNDASALQINLFTYSFELSILSFIFFLMISTILSFLMFYLVNKRIINYAASIINTLIKQYIVNIQEIKKFFSKKMNVNENMIDFSSDISIFSRLVRMSLLNLFDLIVVTTLTVTLIFFNFILFLILSTLFIILVYFQIKTSKLAFKYQQNYKKSLKNLKLTFINNKGQNKEVDKFIISFINRFLIIQKSKNYSNFFLVFIILGVVIYMKNISLSVDEITIYSIFLLLGIRIYVSSCKSIFSYFTSLNLFYLNLRKFTLLISYLNDDEKILNKTILSTKSLNIFDNQEQGIDSIE